MYPLWPFPVGQGRVARDGGPDEVACDGIAIRALPADPDASERVAADQVWLAQVTRAIAGCPDQVVAGSAVDRDSGFIWQGESAGRIGAQEVAIDPVAGGGGPGDVDASAGAEFVDIEPAHGDIRTGDQQTVAVRAWLPLSWMSGVPA